MKDQLNKIQKQNNELQYDKERFITEMKENIKIIANLEKELNDLRIDATDVRMECTYAQTELYSMKEELAKRQTQIDELRGNILILEKYHESVSKSLRMLSTKKNATRKEKEHKENSGESNRNRSRMMRTTRDRSFRWHRKKLTT